MMVYVGQYDFLNQENVIFGVAASEKLVELAAEADAQRILIVSTPSLTQRSDAIDDIATALGPRLLSVYDDIVEHAPLSSVLALAATLRAHSPDLVVSVGGGSVIDSVKVALLALTADATSEDELLALKVQTDENGNSSRPTLPPFALRQIIVPTTLSGAEFGTIAGSVDSQRGVKEIFAHADMCGATIIYDPQLATLTPNKLWISTGVRAVDHAVETILSKQAHPYTDGSALHALRLFANHLHAGEQADMSLEDLQQCQFAVWLATIGLGRVPYGASHGIGHQLGAVAGVPHGLCSCVLLPSVLRYNQPAAGARDAWIAEALGQPDADGANAVSALIKRLGLEDRLQAVGVKKQQFDAIAKASLPNMFVRNNLRPVSQPAHVLEILEAAW